jgi:endoglucanase
LVRQYSNVLIGLFRVSATHFARFPVGESRSMPMRIAMFNLKRSLLTLLFVSLLGSQAHAENGYVRVNQIGYEAGLPARAYLMTRAFGNAKFSIIDSSGATAASGSVGALLGTWGHYSVYPIDFNLSRADVYAIVMSNGVSATSPTFRVDTPEHLYTQPLANNLYFYENERDGADFIPTALRSAPGHLNDAKATVYLAPTFDDDDNFIGSLVPTGATIDAEGGWWDAGDYLKFVQTESYVVSLMLIGVRDFPHQMGAQSASSNFTNEAEFGVRWLEKMWNDDSRTLYYQVGIGTDFEDFDYLSDHDIWRLPQVDDTYAGDDPTFQYIRHRPVFQAGPAGSKVSPNLAGRLAADFAECFQVFQTTNPTLAKQCIFSAEHVFDLADTAPTGNLVTVSPWDFYPEGEWRDDMELGATELYYALAKGNLPAGLPHTDASHYLQLAAHWARAYISGPGDGGDTLNLYDVSGLAHFELYRAIEKAGNPAGLAVSKQRLLDDMAFQISNSVANNAGDPFQFGLPWGTYDSISHGSGLAVMAAEYNYLKRGQSYDDESRRWLGNISGANAWGVAFTVGDGDTFPDCMQHQVANIVGSTDGQTPVLAGAVVEGANSFPTFGFLDGMVPCPVGGRDVYKQFNGNGAVYKDNMQSYSTDEPAVDLTASSFLMYAWRISGGPAD